MEAELSFQAQITYVLGEETTLRIVWKFVADQMREPPKKRSDSVGLT